MKTTIALLLLLTGCAVRRDLPESCPLVGLAYEDSPMTYDSVCIRTWTVIDWCRLNDDLTKGLKIYYEAVDVGSDLYYEPTPPHRVARQVKRWEK